MKLITHYVIMSSSYTEGKRIALHFIANDELNKKEYSQVIPYIQEKCGEDVSISTHMIQTESIDWESVVEADHFFKDVAVIDDKEVFIQMILKDRVLNGADVAKYILSKIECTHLKLEKLVYFCYADYLCNYKDKLFVDDIMAYKYGPVIRSVYDRYTGFGYKEIKDDVKPKNIDASNIYEMPSRSRILFAKNGVAKVASIDATLKKYGSLAASELVSLTHNSGTPWSKTSKINFRRANIIKDDLIMDYHYKESL